jgi:hypothetical protein
MYFLGTPFNSLLPMWLLITKKIIGSDALKIKANTKMRLVLGVRAFFITNKLTISKSSKIKPNPIAKIDISPVRRACRKTYNVQANTMLSDKENPMIVFVDI